MKYFIHTLLIFCAFLNAQAQNNSVDNQNAETVKLGRQQEYGKCYAKCINQEELVTVEEQILLQPDPNKYPNLEPIYAIEQEQTLVKKASFKLIIEPPVFETIMDSVQTTKISKYTGTDATVIDWIRVSTEAGHWTLRDEASMKKANCVDIKSPEECPVVCWEKILAQYEKIIKKTVKRIDSSEVKETKVEYKQIEKKVLKTPASLKIIENPAEYQTVNRQLIVAYKNGEEMLQPQYRTITKTKLVKRTQDNLDWQEVVCDVNINVDLIKRVQQALKERGYYDGPVNGIQNGETNQAIKKFKQDGQFPVCGLVGPSTKWLKALGVY